MNLPLIDRATRDRPLDYRRRNRGDHGDNRRENFVSHEGEIREDSTVSGNVTSVAQPEDTDSTWKVEFNRDTNLALKLDLVHTLTPTTIRTYAAFSMDGKYLATVS